MGKVTGFLEFGRETPKRRLVIERIHDWRDVYQDWAENEARNQAARCMNCGVPFCNNGCPLGNLIPDFNDFAYQGDWKNAIVSLHSTNNFPEFTGRICPAPCEAACTLSINRDPVTIEMMEKTIAEKAWKNGWVTPQPPQRHTGKNVAVVGSGPAGLAVAQQLNRVGHHVTVFERNEFIGGLLSLGIPDFKLEKHVIDRRVRQMEQEGVIFRTRTNVGVDVPADQMKREFNAIVLAGGSTIPRDLPVPGRDVQGIHFAMDYLMQQNRRNRGYEFSPEETLSAKGKIVVIIGGGDTGADCLGTSHRQGAVKTIQLEIMPRPPDSRVPNNPWPQWPNIFRVSSAHEEGDNRGFAVLTKRFETDERGHVARLVATRVEWKATQSGGRPVPVEVPGSEFVIDTQLVLLAMGFLHPQHQGLLDDLGIDYDPRGNVKTNEKMMSSVEGIFSCGDMQRGQSLVVTAISSGRSCAHWVDEWLMGSSNLPVPHRYFRRLTALAT